MIHALSRMYLICLLYTSVGVLSMDRFSQLMGSANARDFTAVRDKQALGLTMAEAIDAVLKDRGVYEQ